MSRKVALITGVSGQDGSYLAELLLRKDYVVHGVVRRNSDFTSKRIDPILFSDDFHTHYGDIVDVSSLHSLLERIEPDEIYNLAAQSHVAVSFEVPDYSAQANALGPLRLLSAVRETGSAARFYQASTSEMFGDAETDTQNESTPFKPRSPYAAAKLFAHWTTVNYRDAYGLHASNGILFNHESPRRGRTFVTKKISTAVARIAQGRAEIVKLGNLDAERDWGYAPEYAEAMWLMLQQDTAGDYVVGSGACASVRDFAILCFAVIGVDLDWSGEGVEEIGRDRRTGEVRVKSDPVYYRPLDVAHLRADPAKAKRRLHWSARTSIAELADLMVRYDLAHDEYGQADAVDDTRVARWTERRA